MAEADEPGVLHVEASDDEHTIYALCGLSSSPFEVDRPRDRLRILHGGRECFRVRQDRIAPSRESALGAFKAAVASGQPRRIGVMVDADDNLAGAWERFRNVLLANNYDPTGTDPDPDGAVIVPSRPELPMVGAWFMPDNTTEGKLEDFIGLLVPDEQGALWQHAVTSVSTIPEGHRHFKPSDTIKAQVHTYLAWQDEPGRPIGQSITRNYFAGDSEHAQRLVEWLRRLFVAERPD